jgi:hypothetical protein
VAKKYDKSSETIKALAKYNELKTLENDVEDLLKRKIELESKINASGSIWIFMYLMYKQVYTVGLNNNS